ncbi:MAG: hypothetical protein RR497_06405, partial [Oscillospiraceae bacterium]
MTSKNSKDWVKLDNAAKIFPPTSNKADTKVFRFSCQLKDEICPEDLQKALDMTMEDFPIFQSVLRHGLFWYYLEHSDITPVVTQESQPPCSMIYDGTSKHLLFAVTYFKCRINLDTYHALADGTGSMQFIKTMLNNYIALHYNERPITVSDFDSSYTQRNEDSFQKYYSDEKKSKKLFEKKSVYKFNGQKIPGNRLSIIEGEMSVQELLKIAHSHNTTLTIYLASVFLYSIYQDMPRSQQNKAVTMDIPVNLRNYFHSATTRNFFSVMNVSHIFSQDNNTLQSVIDDLKTCFHDELTPTQLEKRISKLTKIERNYLARAIPLIIKDPILKFANYVAQKNITCSVSNLGAVTVPPEYEKYVEKFI